MRTPKIKDRIPENKRKPFSNFGALSLNHFTKKISPIRIAHTPMIVTKTAADISGLSKMIVPNSTPNTPSIKRRYQAKFSFRMRIEPIVNTNPPSKIEIAK